MKYSMVLKFDQETLFKAFVRYFVDDYYATTGNELSYKDLYEGLSYEKHPFNSRSKVNVAHVTLTKYSYPNCYRFEYRSNLSYKVSGFIINKINDKESELIVEEYAETLDADGNSDTNFTHTLDQDEVKNATITQKWQFKQFVKKYVKKVKKEGEE